MPSVHVGTIAWTFFGYFRCTDSLSELESIGRSNLTWPTKDLGRTVLSNERVCIIHLCITFLFSNLHIPSLTTVMLSLSVLLFKIILDGGNSLNGIEYTTETT